MRVSRRGGLNFCFLIFGPATCPPRLKNKKAPLAGER